MGKVPDSYATIDAQMLLKTEDEVLRRFLGQGNQDMFTSFLNYLHADDRDKFKNAVREIREKDMPKNEVMIRLADGEKSYHWSVIEMTGPTASSEADHTEIYHLHVTDPDDDIRRQLEEHIDEYGAYLDLLNGILFSYEVAAKRLFIFMRNGGQQLTFFDGSLDDWQTEMKNGKLDAGSDAVFSGLCRDLEMRRSAFSYTVKTSFFSSENKKEQYQFKAQLVDGPDGGKILGCIRSVEQHGGMQTGSEYVRDTAIPVLNKKSIMDYAKRAMTVGDNKVCLVILDLDNFKTVNDTLGHMVGDEVLLRTAEIIKAALGDRGILGRIGGDEMMIVFPQVESETELRNTLRTIRTNIEWEYQDKWEEVKVTCSMGAAVYPDNGKSYDETFGLADKMLYIAKSKGKNRYVIFVPEIHGALLNPDQKTTEDILQKVQGDRSGVMQQLQEQFLMRHAMTFEQVLNSVGTCFNLDGIVCVSGKRFSESRANIWSHQGYQYGVKDPVFCSPEPGFLDSFDDNNTLVIHAIANLESKTETLYTRLKEEKVESVLFYKFAPTSKYSGYLIFAKSSRRQMWSEEDKVLLALVGKIVELAMAT